MSKTIQEIAAIIRVAEPLYKLELISDYVSKVLNKAVKVSEIKQCLTNNVHIDYYLANPYEHLLACRDIGYLKLVSPAKRIKELENIVDMGTNGYSPEYNINGEAGELLKFDLTNSVNAIKAIRDEISLLTNKTSDSITEIKLSIVEDNNNT